MKPRVLFLGENWYGSCARACCYALRRLGCDVMDIDAQTIFPQLRQLSSRAALRIFGRRLIREYNDLIVDVASSFKPDILLAFKGHFVEAHTLCVLRKQGIALYNYHPDRVIFARGTMVEEALPEYDCVFDTKRLWDGDMRVRIKLRNSMFLPHGYDSEVHSSLKLDSRDITQYGCDVSLIATHSPLKEEVLRELVGVKPGIDLRIWGNQWDEHCRTKQLKKYIRGVPLVGSSYARAIQAARVNLAIMGVATGAKDETTTRTYEIPACGGFMLHERTDEVMSLFEEGKEIACFGSIQELANKIDYYLANSEEREAMARAGHSRCVPAYSYDNRMAELLRWHEERLPGRKPG